MIVRIPRVYRSWPGSLYAVACFCISAQGSKLRAQAVRISEPDAVRQLPAVFFLGNERTNIDHQGVYPAAYSSKLDNVIAVANAKRVGSPGGTRSLALARSSNYGTEMVQLACPGTDIESTVPADYSPMGRYASKSGTSMAAPALSGARTTHRSSRFAHTTGCIDCCFSFFYLVPPYVQLEKEVDSPLQSSDSMALHRSGAKSREVIYLRRRAP